MEIATLKGFAVEIKLKKFRRSAKAISRRITRNGRWGPGRSFRLDCGDAFQFCVHILVDNVVCHFDEQGLWPFGALVVSHEIRSLRIEHLFFVYDQNKTMHIYFKPAKGT